MWEFGLGGRDESDREQRMAEYLGIDIEAVRGLELFSRAHALLDDRGEDELADLLEARRLLVEATARLEGRAPSEWVTVMSELSRVHERLADAEPGRTAQHLENAIAVRLRAAESGGRADDHYHLAQLYDRRVVGSSEENYTHAVRHARAAIAGYDRTTQPVYWSDAQHVLGDILLGEPNRAAGRDTDEAIRCFDLALEVRSPEDDVVRWARTLWRRGVAFDARRNADRGDNVREALSCFSNALDRLEARDNPPLWASLHHSAAVTLGGHEFGDPAENAGLALDHLHRCLEVLTRENHPERWADIQHALGVAYDELLAGDRRTNLESAVEHFGRALEVYTADQYPGKWGRGQRSLGIVHSRLQELDTGRDEHGRRAEHHLKEALRVRPRERYPHEWAITIEALAAVRCLRRWATPEEMTDALNHLNEAAEVHAAAGDDAALTANRAVRLRLAAQIERSQDRDPGSGASRSTAPADVDETRALLDRTPVTDRPTQHRLLAAHSGDLLAGLGRWAEAADAYLMALEAEERLVSAVITRAGRESAAGERPVARNAAYVLARAGRLDDALVVLERGRARALSDRLGDDLAGPDGPGLARLREIDPDLADRYARARECLRDAQDADRSGSIGRRRERPGDPAGTSPRPAEESEDPSGLVEIARRTRKATAELDALVSRIRGIDGFHGFRRPADLDVIHRAAEPGCPLVYLATTNWGTVMLVVVASLEGPIVETVWSDFTDEDAYAILMFPANPDNSRFPFQTGFLMRQEGLVETVFADGNAALTRGDAFGQGVVQRTGRDEDGGMWRLGERVVAPLADVLRRHDATDAVLVISGRLGEFPVHTAPLHRGADAPCLLDTVDVAFAPSARVLLHCRTRARGFWPAPSFGGLADPRPHPTPLAFAEQETRRIALLFVQSTVRAGTDATRAAALSAFTSVSYVHLACHGGYQLGDHSPHLEFENAAELHLADMIRERPFASARLVTLSACQTAIPSARAGENDEVDGLPSGLLAAGTPAVVATLWPVDDLSTTLLMERFYAYQLYGDPALGAGPLLPHRALSRAQRWLSRVTAGELADFFANQPSLRQDVESLPSGSGYPASTAARNAIRFGSRDPDERPFAESWFWGAFVLIGA